MAGPWTKERFPQFSDRLERLTKEHRELEDEPLHLAISYDPGRDPQDIFLFEVVGNFANNEISPERDLFEVTFGSSQTFPLEQEQWLHLVLTSPKELDVALDEGWQRASELREALRQEGRAKVLYQDETGKQLMEMIRG